MPGRLKKTSSKKKIKQPVKISKRVSPSKISKEESDHEVSDAEESDIELDESVLPELSFANNVHIFNPEKYENNIHKEIIIVPPDQRKTSEIMSRFEYTEVVSHRAKHIELGGPIFGDIGAETDPIKMAEIEIRQRKCPLAIRRMYNSTVGEVWEVNEMTPPY